MLFASITTLSDVNRTNTNTPLFIVLIISLLQTIIARCFLLKTIINDKKIIIYKGKYLYSITT